MNLPLTDHVFAFDMDSKICHSPEVDALNPSDGWLGKVRGRKGQMTVEAHLESLQKKHVALEEELHSLMASPSRKDTEIAECKRRKLRIKDEIQRLKSSVH